MKYKVIPSKRFEKDMKRCQKRGYDLQLIKDAIGLLAKTGTLPADNLLCFEVFRNFAIRDGELTLSRQKKE